MTSHAAMSTMATTVVLATVVATDVVLATVMATDVVSSDMVATDVVAATVVTGNTVIATISKCLIAIFVISLVKEMVPAAADHGALEMVSTDVGSWCDLDEVLLLTAGKALTVLTTVNSLGNLLKVGTVDMFAWMAERRKQFNYWFNSNV